MDLAAGYFSLQSHTTVLALTWIYTGLYWLNLYTGKRSLPRPLSLVALHPHLSDTDMETINTPLRYRYRNNSHIHLINGKMSNTGRAFYSYPAFVGSVNAVHGADSLAQLDIWDIYRSSFPVDWLSGGLFFIDPSFRKQNTPQVRRPRTHPENADTGNIVHGQ